MFVRLPSIVMNDVLRYKARIVEIGNGYIKMLTLFENADKSVKLFVTKMFR